MARSNGAVWKGERKTSGRGAMMTSHLSAGGEVEEEEGRGAMMTSHLPDEGGRIGSQGRVHRM